MRFTFQELPIPGARLITPQLHRDSRGWFAETWRASDFAAAGLERTFVQANLSRSAQRVLRGLHYQIGPTPQAKLVHVLAGRVFDVIADLRPGSPAFGRWFGVELDVEAGMVYVPAGCAHGFQALTDEALVSYKVDREYDAAVERSVAWNDPQLAVSWPLTPPLLSERDAAAPLLADAELPHG